MTTPFRPVCSGALAGLLALAATPLRSAEAGHPDIVLFFQAASVEDDAAEPALAAISEAWRDGYAAMLVDIARFMPPRRRSPSPSALGGGGVSPGLDDSLGGRAAGPGAAGCSTARTSSCSMPRP